MSGVSEDQMKVPAGGNTAKNVDVRNISWTQQDDESSYDNLASPVNEEAAAQNSMQFQYPPFNAKESQPTWNNYKSRKSPAPLLTSNYDSNKKYNKSAYYNNKRDDYQHNSWGSNNYRKPIADHSSGNYNKGNRFEDSRNDGYGAEKLDNRHNANNVSEEKKSASAPKKTTWASIASQPAKLTSRTALTTSSHKKKGPGMPPPPMVPGKHNLDVNVWDIPNNNPPPVPSPPPPIDLASCDINSDFSPGVGADFDLAPSGQKKAQDISRDDNIKGNYGNNFGRVRSSPNGHSRKNWSNNMQQDQLGGRQSGHIRRGDGNMGGGERGGGGSGGGGGGGNSGGGSGVSAGRYVERKPNYVSSRQDHDDHDTFDYREESISRNVVETNEVPAEAPQAVLEELRDKNNYNPAEIDLEIAASARFFVIKSYSEDDIHRSIKYEIWCSTDHGNKRLDDAFKERHKDGGNILLFFSVNGSGHFCGMAHMITAVDYNSTSSVWSQDKWKGKFKVKWIYVKDVPNNKLRHITLENNENKPVTNSRDTQEVPNSKGVEVLKILHAFKHTTSIFDDFYHYEKKQEEEVSYKKPSGGYDGPPSGGKPHFNLQRQNDDRDGRGGMQQKYYGTGSSFRERNPYRGPGYNQHSDQRRFESHRGGDRNDSDADRENNEYNNSSRHMQKYDYNRRGDDRSSSKHTNRERDFPEEQHGKNESLRIRSGPRETQQKVNTNAQF